MKILQKWIGMQVIECKNWKKIVNFDGIVISKNVNLFNSCDFVQFMWIHKIHRKIYGKFVFSK